MSCRKASTVSVITVGSRAKPASRISPASASCLQSHSSRSVPSRLSTPSPKSQKRQSILVPAAAAACASSRPSFAGNSRSPAARRFRQRSGSTPHDADASPRHTCQHSPPVVALARQRRRLPRHAGSLRNHKEKTQNLVAQNALPLDRTSTYVPPTWQNGSRCRFASSQAHLSSWPNPHSTRGTAAAHIPRFRALALFGRRPLERVDNPTIPASENLHITGHGAPADVSDFTLGGAFVRQFRGREPPHHEAKSPLGYSRHSRHPVAAARSCFGIPQCRRIEDDNRPVFKTNPFAQGPRPQLLVDALAGHADHFTDFPLRN